MGATAARSAWVLPYLPRIRHDEYSLLPVLNAVFVAIGLAVLLGAMLVLALFKSAHLRNQVLHYYYG